MQRCVVLSGKSYQIAVLHRRRLAALLASAVACGLAPGEALAQPAAPVVSICSNVRLQRSAVTDIMTPVVNAASAD